MEEIHKHGEWWVEGHPESKFRGELSYDPSGEMLLEIQGEFPTEEDQHEHRQEDIGNKKIPVIYGDIGSARIASVHGATLIGSNRTVGHTTNTEERYLVEKIFLGGHVSKEQQFSHITLEIDGLEDWLNEAVLHRVIDRETVSELVRSEEVEEAYAVAPPRSIQGEIGDHNVELIKTSRSLDQVSSIEIEVCGLVKISPPDSDTLESLLESATTAIQYVSLGMGIGVLPEKIKVTEAEGGTKGIELLVSLPFHGNRIKPNPSTHLFRPGDVNFERSFNEWVEHRESANIFHEHHDQLLHDPNISPVHKFLSLVIALESYHDHLFPNRTLMDEEEFDRLYSDIIEGIPDDAEVKTRLSNLEPIVNEPSLRKQLMGVVSEYGDLIPELIDVDSTLSDIRDTRHAIAHGLSSVDEEQVIALNQKLDFILKSIILREIGVDVRTAAQALINRHRGFLDVEER